MLFTNLETKRLFLKIIDKDDADFILTQFSNDDVNRYLFDAEPFSTMEEAEELIDFYTEEEPRNQNRWIMIKKDSGEKIGTCGFHAWNREQDTCEMGYDLYPSYRKNGYMQESLVEILRFAESKMQIKYIETHIAEGNADSVRASEKQGFTDTKQVYTEVFRGKEYLHMIYARSFGNDG